MSCGVVSPFLDPYTVVQAVPLVIWDKVCSLAQGILISPHFEAALSEAISEGFSPCIPSPVLEGPSPQAAPAVLDTISTTTVDSVERKHVYRLERPFVAELGDLVARIPLLSYVIGAIRLGSSVLVGLGFLFGLCVLKGLEKFLGFVSNFAAGQAFCSEAGRLALDEMVHGVLEIVIPFSFWFF